MGFWSEVLSTLKGMLIMLPLLAVVFAAMVLSFVLLNPLIGIGAYVVSAAVVFVGVAIMMAVLGRIAARIVSKRR